MGLFSFKQKPAPQTPLEAIQQLSHGEHYSYTTQKGNVYDDEHWHLRRGYIASSFGAQDIDDSLEMFAPNFIAKLNRMEAMLEKILEQNIILQKRCTFLEEHCVGENDTRKSSQDTISR
ncbi:hypothetical protein [uncultured Mitsuokella sp.]|uniref:hypothetical protein n=1 Tax=uncultured Mitsuokella sp. TaxID=453120 RepID=UPI0026288C4C|nr:hypothetical protein [uncultured Mitsuokella sp.]